MPKTFTQKLHFAASPAELFKLYADPKLHTAATGSPATGGAKPGRVYSAWDGYIRGKTLHVEEDRLIVQTWRASDWRAEDPDSILVLLFLADATGSTLHLTQANVPDDQAEGLKEGWTEFYWRPWKKWLADKKTR
jgi:activator of HSP90 ATPase